MKAPIRHILLGILIILSINQAALAESVYVKYRGTVSLGEFDCNHTESSLVKRICYKADDQYLVVLLRNTYYHYCRVPSQIFKQWMSAESKGSYYAVSVKGKFDCRLGGVPN